MSCRSSSSCGRRPAHAANRVRRSTNIAVERDGHLRSRAFLLAYGCANAGGVIAYLPLLTFILPIKIQAISPESKIAVLSLAVLAGAIAASLSNILCGALSDRSFARHGVRTPWVVAGLIATLMSYAAITAAMTPGALIAAVTLFQLAVNMLLAPLLAIMADEVPDEQKGVAGGLLAAGTPLAWLVLLLITVPFALGTAEQLATVGACVVLLVVPLLGRMRRNAMQVEPALPAPVRGQRRADLLFFWASRLCLQVANAVLFTFLLFIFERAGGRATAPELARQVARVAAGLGVLSLPLALVAGWFSDRVGARKPFLLTAASVAAAGLMLMALLPGWWPAVIGYGLFACGSVVFLALQAGYAIELLPAPDHRGRDLGLLNLANTVPAIIAPILTGLFARDRDFGSLLMVLALITITGGILALAVDRPRSGKILSNQTS